MYRNIILPLVYMGVWVQFWWGNLRERDYLEDPVDGKILLKRIFKR
jgi:hypothetical protein